jgi:hypothetical protein
MACIDIAGNGWRAGRLLFDDAADAVQDVCLDLGAPDSNGNFTGSFRNPDGTPNDDRLVNGRCTQQGQRHHIEFTREHVGGTITTSYFGRVTIVQPTGEVLIRGRFTRTTTSSSGPVTSVGGDHETEKPT